MSLDWSGRNPGTGNRVGDRREAHRKSRAGAGLRAHAGSWWRARSGTGLLRAVSAGVAAAATGAPALALQPAGHSASAAGQEFGELGRTLYALATPQALAEAGVLLGCLLAAWMLARLIGVSHTTTVRWMKIARGELEGDIYRHVANPIIERLKRADEIDAERGLYEAIKDQRPGAKVDSIHLALRNRIW